MLELPQNLYARWSGEHLGKDEAFIEIGRKPEDIAEENNTVLIGVYEFKRTLRVNNVTTIIDGEIR